MRASVTFDTLEYMDELEKAGMDRKAAESITKATAKAFSQMLETNDLCTKRDALELNNVIKTDLNQTKLDLMEFITATQWKIIGMLATFQTLMIGAFSVIQHFMR